MKWIKPSGVEVETNDMPETITYCRSLGWQEVSEDEAPRRRGRPPKDSTE